MTEGVSAFLQPADRDTHGDESHAATSEGQQQSRASSSSIPSHKTQILPIDSTLPMFASVQCFYFQLEGTLLPLRAAIFRSTLSWEHTLMPCSVHLALRLFPHLLCSKPKLPACLSTTAFIASGSMEDNSKFDIKTPHNPLGGSAAWEVLHRYKLPMLHLFMTPVPLAHRLPVKTTTFRANSCQRNSP